jgi:leader peptidase (prepilin peptidase)/N-methyltransferase
MLSVWLVLVFVAGAGAGGLLNLGTCRLPFEKSLFWPGGRCVYCYQPIRWYDALPLVGYWLRRGRCHSCGARVPLRPFVVEVVTGLGFVGLFYAEVVANVHGLEVLQRRAAGDVPWQGWVVFGHHALLVSFLLQASLIDLDHYEIPLPVTTTGTVVGLVSAVLWPWPWPGGAALPAQPPRLSGFIALNTVVPRTGLYPWPVWYPLPDWLPPGSPWQGLATGLAGALAGTMMLRAVRFVFGLGRGKEGLGVGDADLMMMAGSFLGWQPVVVAFFVSVFPALLLGLLQLAVRGSQELAFGPSLSLGVVLTMLGWPEIGPRVQGLFFEARLIAVLGVAGVVFLFAASFLLRVVRGPGGGDEAAKG